MKIALAMIVKGSNDEAELLDRCLTNMEKYVDGIFITRTHLPNEKPNHHVGNVATKHKAHLSDFEWVYDFGKARNFNFRQVPKEYDYIIWSDADDMWRGLEKLKPTIHKHPNVDAFAVEYLYDWDEFKKPTVVHSKTMVVKNDNAVKWTGAIHEDLEPVRTLDVQFIQGIERLHLSSPKRYESAAQRNLEIAERELLLKPEDPRSFWNLANSKFGVADYRGAISAFNEFIESSQSDDEKYLAYCRLGEIYKTTSRNQEAIAQYLIAIGMRPMFPEAYFQLAYLFYTLGNYEKAEEYALQGMVKRPQVSRMIVYNPRDYDYNPMMLLAQIYYHQNRPDLMLPLLQGCLRIYPNDEKLQKLVKDGKRAKQQLGKALEVVNKLRRIRKKERLKKELDKLPLDLRSHPSIVTLRNMHLKKEESSGRDLVYYCGNTAHEWYDGSTGFVGGSEEAVINLSRELAKLGWNVTVYNNCGHKRREINGVHYIPFWEFNYRDKQDVVILWRWAKPLDAEINSSRIFVDLHDVIPAGEFTNKRLDKVTSIFVKSQFHRSLFPNVPDEKFTVIPNGIELSLFNTQTEKDPYLLINTSSPDRSMDVLPKLFKEVKKKVPQAKLVWAYGWEVFKNSYSNDSKKIEWMKKIKEEIADAGIEEIGRLNQEEIAKLYQKATILAYPTEFAEIDCISVRKAQIAGCLPVTTDFGALEESVEFGVKIHSEKNADNWNKPFQFHFGLEDEQKQKEWVFAVVELLKDKEASFIFRNEVPEGLNGVEEWGEQFSWNKTAVKWNNVLCT